MMVVEVSVLGRRFTQRVGGARPEVLRLTPRLAAQWRQWTQRPPRAAA